MLKTFLVAMSLVLVMSACGSEGDVGGTREETAQQSGGEESQSAFGEAAAAGDAEQTVEITALDDLSFDPASITAQAGETINFVVTNEGKAPHEFVIGDRQYQEEHEKAMEHGGHGEDLGNVVELAPGATEEIAWKFTVTGEVLFACHVDGHYEGGMVGTVEVR